MKLKHLLLLLPFLLFGWCALAQSKPEDKAVSHLYEVTFYTLEFHTVYKEDTSKAKKGNAPDDYFNSFMNIIDYDYNKYKLTDPLTKLFDSAEFVVKDEKGKLLKVGNVELICISKTDGMKQFNFKGPWVSKEAADAMNHSKPGDQIIFRTVEVFDNTLNKQLIIPNFLIVY